MTQDEGLRSRTDPAWLARQQDRIARIEALLRRLPECAVGSSDPARAKRLLEKASRLRAFDGPDATRGNRIMRDLRHLMPVGEYADRVKPVFIAMDRMFGYDPTHTVAEDAIRAAERGWSESDGAEHQAINTEHRRDLCGGTD